MKSKHKDPSPELKAKIAIDGVMGLQTVEELATAHDVQPAQILEWQKILTDSAAAMFAPKNRPSSLKDQSKERDRLLAKINQLQIEKEFLERKAKELAL